MKTKVLSLFVIFGVIVLVFGSSKTETQVEEVAIKDLINTISENCKANHTRFDDESAAVSAIKLFGWLALPSLIKARENINPCECQIYSEILGNSIFWADRNVRSINYNEDISFLVSHFSDPSKTYINFDISNTNNFSKIIETVEKISSINNKYTDSNIEKYLKFVYENSVSGKLTAKDKESFIDTISPLSLLCLPKSSYWLVKFAMNPYAIIIGNTRSDSHNRENLRYLSVLALAKNYKSILSGLIYLSFAEKQYDFVSGYIDVALQSAADIDVEYIRNILKNQTGYSLNSVIISMGKSGNRGYRKLIIPFLKNSETKTKQAASVALSYLGDDKGIENLKNVLENNDSDFKDVAIESLGKLGTEPACELLIEELRQANKYYPSNIIKAMADTCNNEYLISKLLLFAVAEAKTKSYAHDAIFYLADKDNSKALIEALYGNNKVIAEFSADIIVEVSEIILDKNQSKIDVAKKWAELLGKIDK